MKPDDLRALAEKRRLRWATASKAPWIIEMHHRRAAHSIDAPGWENLATVYGNETPELDVEGSANILAIVAERNEVDEVNAALLAAADEIAKRDARIAELEAPRDPATCCASCMRPLTICMDKDPCIYRRELRISHGGDPSRPLYEQEFQAEEVRAGE